MLDARMERKDRLPSREFLVLRDRVEHCREEYLASLGAIRAPLGEMCAQFYTQRIRRVSPKPLLGEYLPWLLGDVFAIDPDQVRRVANAWLPLYLHVLAIDDLLDETSDVDRATLPIVSSVLAERAFAEYLALLGPRMDFWSGFEDFFLTTGAAGAREMTEARGRVASITPNEIRRLGEKIELVKICYSSLVLAAGLDISELHLSALGDFEIGVQLLDDVSDWDEDFAIGSFTPLLALALRGANGKGGLSPTLVLSRLVSTGALGLCLDEAIERLERASAVIVSRRESAGAILLTTMISDARWLRAEEDAVREVIVREGERLDQVDPELLVAVSPRLRAALAKLDSSIKVVAQSS